MGIQYQVKPVRRIVWGIAWRTAVYAALAAIFVKLYRVVAELPLLIDINVRQWCGAWIGYALAISGCTVGLLLDIAYICDSIRGEASEKRI